MAPRGCSISPAGKHVGSLDLYVPLPVPGTMPRGRNRPGCLGPAYLLDSKWCHLHNWHVRGPEGAQSRLLLPWSRDLI